MRRLQASALVAALAVAMVGSFALQQLVPTLTDALCLRPRAPFGLLGVLFAPLLHGDALHLLGNLAVVLPTLWLVRELYARVWTEVLLFAWLGTGVLVWAGARGNCHIGASGLGYALTLFLFASGLLRRDRRSWALALLVLMLNQGWVWGILPMDPSVSWESHLLGGLTGLVLAFWFRRETLPSTESPPSDSSDIPDDIWDYRRHLPPDVRKEPKP